MSTTRLKRVHKASEIELENITVDLTKSESGQLQRLTLTDVNGRRVYFSVEFSVLAIDIDAPPATVKRYKLAGTLGRANKLPFERLFDSEYDAEDAKTELTVSGYANLTITTIEVPEVE